MSEPKTIIVGERIEVPLVVIDGRCMVCGERILKLGGSHVHPVKVSGYSTVTEVDHEKKTVTFDAER